VVQLGRGIEVASGDQHAAVGEKRGRVNRRPVDIEPVGLKLPWFKAAELPEQPATARATRKPARPIRSVR